MQHLDQKDLAERWLISPRTLEQWRWQGRGPRFLKIGGRVVYRICDVEAFESASLHANTIGPIHEGTEEKLADALRPSPSPREVGGWMAQPSRADRREDKLDRRARAGRGCRYEATLPLPAGEIPDSMLYEPLDGHG